LPPLNKARRGKPLLYEKQSNVDVNFSSRPLSSAS